MALAPLPCAASSPPAARPPAVNITDLPDDVVLRILVQLGLQTDVDTRALRRMGDAYAAASICTRWHRVFLLAIKTLNTQLLNFEVRFPSTRDTLRTPHITWLCRNAPNLTEVKLTLFNASAANALREHQHLKKLSIDAEEPAPALRRISSTLTSLILAWPSQKTLKMLANPQLGEPPALTDLHLNVSVEQLPLLRTIIQRVGTSLENTTYDFRIDDRDARSDARAKKLETVRSFITEVCEASGVEMPQLRSLAFVLCYADQNKMSNFPDLSLFSEKYEEVQRRNALREPIAGLITVAINSEGSELSSWIDAAAHLLVKNVSLTLTCNGDTMTYVAPMYPIPRPANFHMAVRLKSMIATLADCMNGGFYFMDKKLMSLSIPERATIVRFNRDETYREFVLMAVQSCQLEEFRLYAPLTNTGLRLVMAATENDQAEQEVAEEVQQVTAMLTAASREDGGGENATFEFLWEVLPHVLEIISFTVSFELVLLARSHPEQTRSMLELLQNVERLWLMMPRFIPLGDALIHGEVRVTEEFLQALPDFLDILVETLPKLKTVQTERLAKAIDWNCPTEGRLNMFQDAFDAFDRFEARRDEVDFESLRVLIEVFKMATPKNKLK